MLAHRGQAGGRARADHVHLVRRGGRVRSAAGHRSGWRDQCAGARAEVLRAMMGSSGAHEGMRGQMSGPGGDAPPFDDPPPPPSQSPQSSFQSLAPIVHGQRTIFWLPPKATSCYFLRLRIHAICKIWSIDTETGSSYNLPRPTHESRFRAP